ncbi:sugar ABC transporter substrate-binding protein [Deinococcus sp. KSM4-11]|uniref:ABC transporter substrate-binding protein n=1 Tax=Deinococcus sp. KSM4-11 TaxID=2568654 RepID=UPI0010A45514|nr:sugar ABC transporter substrate-binding protein [Deinococcus sp. KSM4-11]THF87157.1 sugar ABC transporter substrate-binding protein [Deinococcus sp. KSM4-11]
MKRLTLITAVLLTAVQPGIHAQAQTPVKLRFVSLAWQTQAIAATKAAIAECDAKDAAYTIDYQQVSWDSIQDYLTTSFEAKNVPDIFHYESTEVMEFGDRGYLTDLSKLIPAEMKADVAKGAWATVTADNGAVYGVPFLWESLITLYNKDLFKKAGIRPPTVAKPWSWEEFQAASKKLTLDTNGDGKTDQFGSAFGLRSPTNRILNLALGFGGDYFYKSGNKYVVKVGDKEKALLKILLNMHYTDKSASPDGLTAQSPELFNGFFTGKYAMLPGIGVWARQTIAESGPPGLNWGVLPPIKAVTQDQGSATQTLSIPTVSTHKKEAMQFISCFVNRVNNGKLAAGDWLFPTRMSSLRGVPFQTEANGWKTATESAKYLTMAPFQEVKGFTEVKSKVLTPTFQQLLANRISLDDAAKQIEQQGNEILAKYYK